MSRDESISNLMLFVAGAVVGAACGVLLAPKSGKETREDLTDWLKERREKGAELLAKIKEEIPVKKHQISVALKAGQEAYEQAGHARDGKEHLSAR